MKITKRRLRQVIKEAFMSLDPHHRPGTAWKENQKPTGQVNAAPSKTTSEWVEHLGQIIDQDMTSRGLTSYKEEGAAVMAALEQLRREIKDEMRGPTR